MASSVSDGRMTVNDKGKMGDEAFLARSQHFYAEKIEILEEINSGLPAQIRTLYLSMLERPY
jgi:hypothetical protein